MDDKSYTVRVPKRWARMGLVALVTALIVAPLTAVASHTFNDVTDDNTFHEDIAWLAQSGVTLGCNPPDNDEFCPDDSVTREQMSAFMRRFAQYLGAEDGTPAEADNALMLDGNTVEQLVPRASFNSVDSAPDGAAFQLDTVIEAPAPGIIVTNAGIEAFIGPDSFYRCRIHLNGDPVPGSQMDSELDAGSNSEENCATGGGVAVEAGTHTVTLDVSLVDPGTNFIAAFVWALWVPFDGTGAVPASATQLGDISAVTEDKPSG